MPLPVIADVARVALHCVKGSGGGEPATTVNVIHVKRNTATDWPTTADQIAFELDTVAHTTHSGMLEPVQSSYGYQSFDLTPLDGTSASIHRDGTLSNWPVGQHGGDYIPQVACVVRIRTAVRGRSGRGRVFLGPLAEATVVNGQVGAVNVGQVTTAWQAFANSLQTDYGHELGVASYLHRQFNGATDIGAVQHSATQRRRNLHT
jgi:hypothetical protein